MVAMWLILTALLANPAAQPALPLWLAGCWEQASGERWTEECWNDPRAGIMMGNGRSGLGEQLESWEVMQIEIVDTDDPAIPKMTFHGAPGGQSRTSFTWVPGLQKGITFVNASHDYPQRIRYWREGRDLVAEVSLMDGSNARRWRYHPKAD
jgi:hypothetical protein